MSDGNQDGPVEFDFESGFLTIGGASQADVDAFVWPEGVDYLVVKGDNIYDLVVPDGVTYVLCNDLPLRSIQLPDTVEDLICDNCLKHLDHTYVRLRYLYKRPKTL